MYINIKHGMFIKGVNSTQDSVLRCYVLCPPKETDIRDSLFGGDSDNLEKYLSEKIADLLTTLQTTIGVNLEICEHPTIKGRFQFSQLQIKTNHGIVDFTTNHGDLLLALKTTCEDCDLIFPKDLDFDYLLAQHQLKKQGQQRVGLSL